MFLTFILICIGFIFLINTQKLHKNLKKTKIYFFFVIFVNFIKSLFNQKYEKGNHFFKSKLITKLLIIK